jgi:hypothetical protein
MRLKRCSLAFLALLAFAFAAHAAPEPPTPLPWAIRTFKFIEPAPDPQNTRVIAQIWFDVATGIFHGVTNGVDQVLGAGGGSGTVTNIAVSGLLSGGPITTTGTISCPTCVGTGQTNAYGAFLQDFSASTVEIPESPGCVTTVDSTLCIDTTANLLHFWGGVDKTVGAGAGTVTSASFTGGLISIATPTTTPAFTVAGTSGGIPYFSAASTWASSGALTANVLVKGGGAGAAPTNSSITDNGTTIAATEPITTTGSVSTGSGASAAGATATGGFACAEAATTGWVPTAGQDYERCDSTRHEFVCSMNGAAETGCAGTGSDISTPLACEAASASGTAYTCTTAPSFTPTDLTIINFEADVANTGSATLAVNGAAAATIKKQGGGTNLVANDLLANQWTLLVFDGTNWQMQGQTGNAAGAGTVTHTAGALTANSVVLGNGAADVTVAAADSTTTHAFFATAGAPAFRAIVAGDLPASTLAFPVTGTGIVSGAVPCGTSTTTLTMGAILNTNILVKGGGAGACPTNSLVTDNGTSATYSGTGGYVAPVFVSNGATAGFVDYPQGTTSAAVAPCNVATSICEQAPTAVTSYLVNKPGVSATGIITNNVAAAVITQGISGDANHSATVTTGSGTSIGSTTLCTSANCPAGTYVVHVYTDITTACGTSGTYIINLIYTDDQGAKTIPVNINGTGTVPATGTLTTTSTSNYGENSQVIRLTSGNLNYSTTAVACGTAGPMVGKLYLAAVPVM